MLILCASCSLPWSRQAPADEINLSFVLENNLIYLSSARIDGRPGRFLLASAAPRTVVDPAFPLGSGRRHMLNIGEKKALPFSPSRLALQGVADAMIGADVWGGQAVSIDYRSGLVTSQPAGIYPEYMSLFRYDAEPMINVRVNGARIAAIVDTSSPDTLILPRATEGRGTAHIVIGNTDLGTVDIAYANVARARIGNRLLSHFLVTIDYGKRVVGVWPDPRVSPPAAEGGRRSTRVAP